MSIRLRTRCSGRGPASAASDAGLLRSASGHWRAVPVRGAYCRHVSGASAGARPDRPQAFPLLCGHRKNPKKSTAPPLVQAMQGGMHQVRAIYLIRAALSSFVTVKCGHYCDNLAAFRPRQRLTSRAVPLLPASHCHSFEAIRVGGNSVRDSW